MIIRVSGSWSAPQSKHADVAADDDRSPVAEWSQMAPHLCGNLHRAGLKGRSFAGTRVDLQRSRKRGLA